MTSADGVPPVRSVSALAADTIVPPVEAELAVVEMREQIEAGVATAVAQPIVDLRRGQIAGYEVLARFPSTMGHAIDEWFALAWRHGLGPVLEAQAVARALELRPTLAPNRFLAFNVTPAALVSEEVLEVLSAAGSLVGVLIELTEHAPIEEHPRVLDALEGLRAAGAQVAIDDAGAGHSGLRQILEVRPDVLKLDRSLVSGVDRDEVKRALIEMLGVFADRSDAWILAEGIETASELETVVALGVPLGQGWALARPGPAWVELSPEVAERLGALTPTHVADDDLRSLLQVAPWVCADDVQPGTPSLLLASGGDDLAVLDADRRPCAWVDGASAQHVEGPDLLRVHLDTTVAAVARRMLTRSAGVRFTPAVVTDAAGRYVGVVKAERVLDHLARLQVGIQDVD
jgi:EAL domain-containing protein (putative c-di-GMP-specific phosphodiesterase class I)